MRADVAALEEELHAVVQIVVERDLRDGGVDRDLQLRAVELAQRLLDHAEIFLVGVDQQRVVDRSAVIRTLNSAAGRRPLRAPIREMPRRRCLCRGSAAAPKIPSGSPPRRSHSAPEGAAPPLRRSAASRTTRPRLQSRVRICTPPCGAMLLEPLELVAMPRRVQSG